MLTLGLKLFIEMDADVGCRYCLNFWLAIILWCGIIVLRAHLAGLEKNELHAYLLWKAAESATGEIHRVSEDLLVLELFKKSL